MWKRIAASTLSFLVSTLAAAAPPLGDLTISSSRVPDWYKNEPPNTAGWTVTNVNAADCADNSTTDSTVLNNAITAASAQTILNLQGGGCVYNLVASVNLNKSEILIRGQGTANTIISSQYATDPRIFTNTAASFTGSTNWTAGYTLGTTVLTVDSSTGKIVDDWVRASGTCAASVECRAPGTHGYIAQIDAVSGDGPGGGVDTITLDRGLGTDFTNSTSRVVEEFTPVQKVGFEGLTVKEPAPIDADDYKPFFQLQNAVGWWFENLAVGPFSAHAWIFNNSARNLVRSCIISSQERTIKFNKGVFRFEQSATDNEVVNNALIGVEGSSSFENGAVRNVLAYNYNPIPDGADGCERFAHWHNDYSTSNLVEGNDTACTVQWDDFYSGSGPYNTIYRNRLRSGTYPSHNDTDGHIGPEETNATRTHPLYNVIANHVSHLNGASTNDEIDEDGTDFWIERNVYRTACDLDQNSGSVTPDCTNGTTPFAVNTVWATNSNTQSAPAGWSTFTFPNSLYQLSGAPSWWCSQSGAFPSIGAPSDDAAGVYSKLPAQIMYEGGACTQGGATGVSFTGASYR